MVNDSNICSSKLGASEKSEECTEVIEDTASDGTVNDESDAHHALRSEQSENRGQSNDPDISGQVFPCSLCGKAFDKASSLKQHSHVHTRSTSKSVTCVLCLRRYTQYPNLCRHWRHDHRTEHEILRKISVAIPRANVAMSRAVREDQTNSNLRPDEPDGLIRNWSFPVSSSASDQQQPTTPFSTHGADYFLGNNVSCKAPLTGTRISTTAFTGTKIPAVPHPGVMMFSSAAFTGYPAFPGLIGGAMMPRQSPYVLPGHALHPQLNGHLNHAPPIGQWFGYPTPFPPTFPLLGLLPPTNLLDSHATPWWWSAPLFQIPPVLSSAAKQKEVTSPEVDQTTTITTSRSPSSFHQKRKREEMPEADILLKQDASKIREIAVKRSHLQNDRHHTKRSKVKLEPTITEESNIPGNVEASSDSSTAPKRVDRLEQLTPSGTPGGTDGNRLTVHTLHE